MSKNDSLQTLEQEPKQIKICLYGLDKKGFAISDSYIKEGKYEFYLIKYKENFRLDKMDGVIIPSGIFEEIYDTYYGRQDIIFDKDLLFEIKNLVFNLISAGKWICFLTDELFHDIEPDFNARKIISNTDLSKIILGMFNINYDRINGIKVFQSKYQEFDRYFEEFGIAKLGFKKYPLPEGCNIISESDSRSHVFALEIDSKTFFLPFHTTRRDEQTIKDICYITSEAIIKYRKKRIFEIPSWVNNFVFRKEKELYEKIENARSELKALQMEFESWQNYKSVLFQNGELLKLSVVRILEKYFQFIVDPMDALKEDAKILNDQNQASIDCLLEIKGTNKGIKREHINQVDSHRERNNLDASCPGVIIINNEMNIHSIKSRLETTVPEEQIRHAKNLNVLIVRTIDLLFFMRHLENNPKRKQILSQLFKKGGGWLKADENKYELI